MCKQKCHNTEKVETVVGRASSETVETTVEKIGEKIEDGVTHQLR